MIAFCSQVSLPDCPVKYTIYGYYPSLSANAFFCAWFCVFLIVGIIFGIRYRTWTYMLALSLGCLTETVGYLGRLVMHRNPYSVTGFQIQICCIILGPAFNSAALYLTLKHIVLAFGSKYSMIRPPLYTYIFVGCDLVSLVLQGIGGGLAATSGHDKHQQSLGTHIMIAGIVFQVVVLLAFAMATGLYIHRWYRAYRGRFTALDSRALDLIYDTKFRIFSIAMTTALVAIFCRCVYRIVEMAGGWGNPVMRDQTSFIVLEGAFIAYATGVQTTFHPGFCFPQMSSPISSIAMRKSEVERGNNNRF